MFKTSLPTGAIIIPFIRLKSSFRIKTEFSLRIQEYKILLKNNATLSRFYAKIFL